MASNPAAGPAESDGSSQPGGASAPQPRGSRTEYILPGWMVLGLGIFGLYLLAKAFPSHPKTLERDAVVCGFIGAALLIQEIVRTVWRGLPELFWLLLISAATATLIIGLYAAGLPGLLILLIGYVGFSVLGTLDDEYDLSDLEFLKSETVKKVMAFLAVIVGVALLALAMFLQLRAINLGRG